MGKEKMSIEHFQNLKRVYNENLRKVCSELEDIANGRKIQLKQSNDQEYLYEGDRCQFTIFKHQILYAKELHNIQRSKLTQHSGTNRFFSGVGRRDIVGFIGDPYREIDSIKYAKQVTQIDRIASLHPKVIDMSEQHCKNYDLWHYKEQKKWGDLKENRLYILAGFEKISTENLFNLFRCPAFEGSFEQYQESRGNDWKGREKNHKLYLLITGKAFEIFETERMSYTSATGDINNFLARIGHRKLYCVRTKPQ